MKQQRAFSVIQSLKYGLDTFYNYFFLLLCSQLIFQAILEGLPFFACAFNPSLKHDYIRLQTAISTGADWAYLFSRHTIFLLMMVLIYYILISIVSFGLIQISFDIFDTGSSSVRRLFSWTSRGHKATVVNSLLLLFFVGFRLLSSLRLFLSAPFYCLALYFSMRFSLVQESLVDQNRTIYGSFVHSWKLSSGNVLRLSILIVFIVALHYSILGLLYPVAVHISFQAFGTTIDLIGKEELISMMVGITMRQSFTYAYRQLSPVELN